MSLAISIENISKFYRLGLISSKTLSDDFQRYWARLRGKPDPLLKIGQEDIGNRVGEHIWALRDINIKVEQGELLGIIGKNGAGKSTLLKLLSRITAPTSGLIKVKGRIVSLLEVGTGFHPELTGRENIFLNGAILGMSKVEVSKKLDEIVSFAEIENFIDTPVKRYSSGMYVRLAFAVAAYLEPEILLVDEVLAVGDAAFQKKCLGKMSDVAKGGRTILFVSHNMTAMARLTERAILLEKGKLLLDGPSSQIITKYLQNDSNTTALREWPDTSKAPGNHYVRMRSIRVIDSKLNQVDTIDVRQTIGIEIIFDILKSEIQFVPMIALYREGVLAFNAMDTGKVWREKRKIGRYKSIVWIPKNLLSEGMMNVTVLLSTHSSRRSEKHAYVPDAVSFQVIDPVEGDTARGDYKGDWGGAVRPFLKWTSEYNEF